MKKIVFLISTLDSGGIENYLLRFLKYSEGRIIPIVICKHSCDGELFQEYSLIKNIKIYESNIGYLRFSAYLKFYFLLKEINADAICDFTGNFAGFSMIFSRFLGTKNRLSFYRGSTDHFNPSWIKNTYNDLMKKLVIGNATKILSNSKAAFLYFFGKDFHFDNRFYVLNNGINSESFLSDATDLRAFFGIEEKTFVICHVGRFDSSKNHKTIIEVAYKLCAIDKNINFVLCGKGVDKAFQNEVEIKGFTNKIHLMGFTRDVVKVLNTGDCFYFPSLTEGQPNALIEAIIAGMPVVASNIEAIKETLPDFYYDQLVDPCDIDNAIKKIMLIKENSELRQKLNISDWAKSKFDADRLFSKFLEFLLEK